MGQVWRNWRLFCSGTSFRCVFSLQSSCCIPLPQAFASPKWLSLNICCVSSLAFLEYDLATVSRLPTLGSCTIPLLALSSASPLWSPWTCPLDYQFKFLLCFLLVSFLPRHTVGHPRKFFLSFCHHTRTTVLKTLWQVPSNLKFMNYLVSQHFNSGFGYFLCNSIAQPCGTFYIFILFVYCQYTHLVPKLV